MAKQAMLFDFQNIAFENFRLKIANKKSLSRQRLPLHELKRPFKKTYFFTITKFCIPGYYTGNMLLAVLKNDQTENHMKLILNTST